MIANCSVYEDGRPRAERLDLSDAYEACRTSADAFVWIGLVDPTQDEFDAVSREFELHELAVEDAIKAHQRPKLDVYGDMLFLVLKTAHYHQDREEVEIGEINVFAGPGYVITVRHGAPSELVGVRRHVESRTDLLRCGPGAVLHAIVDRVVDDYLPVLEGIEDDIEEVEEEVFAPRGSAPTQRIYQLKREAIEMSRATGPLVAPLERLVREEFAMIPDTVREYFRDVYDHAVRYNEQVDAFGDRLNGVLNANVAQVSLRLNEDVRKISSWAAIIAVPTMIAGIYGMNFEHMPELRWELGYPLAVAAMALACFLLYAYFKRRRWL